MQVLSNPISALNVRESPKFCVFEKIGVEDTMVMLYFRPEVEIWPFRACTMKNMQCNPYSWPNCLNFCVSKEIGVYEHNGDVRFKSRSGNMAVLCMRNASGHNYRNSSVTVDLSVGQILRSTERISSSRYFPFPVCVTASRAPEPMPHGLPVTLYFVLV